MNSKSLLPVILCGGTGSRLWPLSRASYPKQYLALSSKSKKSLLQQTQQRLEGLKNLEEPILICNEDHRFIVAEQMRQININPKSILLEPFGRNTAPAIAIAALKARENGEDPTLLILSADHVIKDTEKFLQLIEEGSKEAENGRLVTFGVVPTSPETGYGYIEAIHPLSDKQIKGSPIAQFIEKPDQENANKLFLDERFTWNSGIFLFKSSVILKELQKYAPKVLDCCKEASQENLNDLSFQRLKKEAFNKCPEISIDVAVMEKTKLGTVLPLQAGWSDVGSWKSLWETTEKDNDGNAILGRVLTKSTKNCYLRSENRLVVGIGIDDLIVVETNDVVLVANKKNTQEVKQIVNQLDSEGSSEGREHRTIYRPWGHYTSIVEGSRWKVKRIQVKPGETLSLQMHHHRAEHWIVVTGTAQVEINDKKSILSENQSTYIPLGSKHRLSNKGRIPLVLIEVQSGSYLNEDDIVRFEDKYGRTD